jgi:hypothetical protein
VKKFVVVTLFCLAIIGTGSAQEDTTRVAKAQHFLDSLVTVSDGQWLKDSITVLSWSDSLNQKINTKFNLDSLSLTRKIDSLQRLRLPTEKYTQKLDSLTGKKNELIGEVNEKQQSMLSKTKGRWDEWKSKLKANVGLDSLSSSSGLKINDPNVPGLPGMPAGDIPGLNIPEMPSLQALDFQNLQLSPELTSFHESLPFNKLEGLQEIQDKIGSASGTLSQVTAFTKDTDKAIDGLVGKIEPVQAVQDRLKLGQGLPANEFTDRAKQLEDPNALKQEAQQQVVKQAVNHFAGKEEQLKQAMDKMAKYKAKYSSVNSIKDLPKKRPNEMKGKPFIERLRPGIAFQIQKKNDLLVDFNPYLGYRVTGRLTSGLGWNQRVAFVRWNQYNTEARIFGPRVYTEYRLWKGFSPRAEIEVMNTYVPPIFKTAPDNGGREWVWSYMIGLKKEYRFYKNVRGTAMVMFNLYNAHHKSPYVDVVNTRFGFEFPLKKKVKEEKK